MRKCFHSSRTPSLSLSVPFSAHFSRLTLTLSLPSRLAMASQRLRLRKVPLTADMMVLQGASTEVERSDEAGCALYIGGITTGRKVSFNAPPPPPSPSTMTFTLPSPYRVNATRLETTDDAKTTWAIEWSDDGETWTQVATHEQRYLWCESRWACDTGHKMWRYRLLKHGGGNAWYREVEWLAVDAPVPELKEALETRP